MEGDARRIYVGIRGVVQSDVTGYSPLQCCSALDLQLDPFFALCPLLAFNYCCLLTAKRK